MTARTGGTKTGTGSIGPRSSVSESIHRPGTSQVDDGEHEQSLSSKDVLNIMIKEGTYCVNDGDPVKLQIDEAKTRVTFITLDQEKALHQAAQQKMACPLPWVKHTIFLVDIFEKDGVIFSNSNPNAPKGMADKTVTIKYTSLEKDGEEENMSFVFADKRVAAMWFNGLNVLKKDALSVYERNPSQIVLEKRWLLADRSGDGDVDAAEILETLDRINIKKSVTTLNSILEKVVNEEQKKPTGIRKVFAVLEKIQGPKLKKGISLNKSQFKRFIELLENHDTRDMLWQRYCKTPRLTQAQMARFMEIEQKEPSFQPVPKGKWGEAKITEQRRKIQAAMWNDIVNAVAPGKTSISKKMFETFLRQSKLNTVNDLDSETKPDSDGHRLPVVDYWVNTAVNCSLYDAHLMGGNDDDGGDAETQVLSAIRYHLNAGVRCLHFVLELSPEGFTIQGVNADAIFAYLSDPTVSHPEPTTYPLILRLDMNFYDRGAENRLAGLLQKHFDKRLGKKKHAPWQVLPVFGIDPPPVGEEEVPYKFEPVPIDVVTSLQKDILIMLGLRTKTEKVTSDALQNQGKGGDDWDPKLKKLAHFECIEPMFTSLVSAKKQAKSGGPEKLAVSEIIKKYTEKWLPKKKYVQTLIKTKKRPEAELKIKEIAEQTLLPVVVLTAQQAKAQIQLEEAEDIKRKREEEKARAEADEQKKLLHQQMLKAGKAVEEEAQEDDDENARMLEPGRDPVYPDTLKDLTRTMFVYTTLMPLRSSLNNEEVQSPEDYHSAASCWSQGIQFVGIFHKDYHFEGSGAKKSGLGAGLDAMKGGLAVVPGMKLLPGMGGNQKVQAGSLDYKIKTSPYRFDNSWWMSRALFTNNMGNGWIRKPWLLRSVWSEEQKRLREEETPMPDQPKPLYIRRPTGSCTFMVRVISGHMLPEKEEDEGFDPLGQVTGVVDKLEELLKGEKKITVPDPFVEVRVDGVAVDYANNLKDFIGPGSSAYRRTKEVMDNGFCPQWDERFTFRIKCKEAAFLTLSVWDCDTDKSEHTYLCQNTIHIGATRLGYRCVPLRNWKGGIIGTCPSLMIYVSECRDGDAEQIAKDIDNMTDIKQEKSKRLAELKAGYERERDTIRQKNKKSIEITNELNAERKKLQGMETRMCHCGLLGFGCAIQ